MNYHLNSNYPGSMNQSEDKDFGYSKPAIYQIKVEGVLSQDWSERLRGMQIELKHRKGKKPISVLTGKIPDQGSLAGVLKTLYEFHLPIIQVRKLHD